MKISWFLTKEKEISDLKRGDVRKIYFNLKVVVDLSGGGST